ncbi:Glycerol-3-phosphate 2-O-acyltransferase 6 [Apostasia shenzhenica]|uniref:Glycerol-3-phosphate 2-O-acyltransferase 6 n=1 Tax=Apostasia shenzhenica TaxID=1088818 RepID=A0A2I0B0U2_9ASPA|nr:Glycerol-3-phosphate 2-O-acyltransferase 6 [Apostasia shenzhenica]
MAKISPPPPFPAVSTCPSDNRESHTVVADLDGTLLCGRSSFPYFALVAFEAGGVLRLLLLVLLSPLAAALYHFVSEPAGIRVLIFASVAGVRISTVEAVARAVLPKFYLSDLHPESWRVFSSCGRRWVLTANPRIMVEAFLKEYLGAEMVVGTELADFRGRATGMVRRPGVLVGEKKAAALKSALGSGSPPEIGLGDRRSDFPFMNLCKEAYVVLPDPEVKAVSRERLPKPVVFHDGRLVQKPTPLLALLIVLWFPFAFFLACLRAAAAALLPIKHQIRVHRLLGVRISVKGAAPWRPAGKPGVLFVCSHRTLLDPLIVSLALRRHVATVTYSLSRLSELLSPIKNVRLARDRGKDAATIKSLLEEGDVAVCPEGTTCREPFLLRFSALFAELTDEIVPVALESRTSLFHGTTARGWKGMDPFFFCMNPSPAYEVTFLSKLPPELTCGGGGGRASHEVANCVQRMIAESLGYECTSFTRKDKYMALAGNDGSVPKKTRSKLAS